MKGPTQQYSDTIKSLQSRIQALEDENRLLKERLEEAGVSYANIVSGDLTGIMMVKKMSSSMIMWTVIFQSSIKCIQQG